MFALSVAVNKVFTIAMRMTLTLSLDNSKVNSKVKVESKYAINKPMYDFPFDNNRNACLISHHS